MGNKKEPTKGKKVAASKKHSIDKLLEEHPLETESQIRNRYGVGRERSGSDGTHQDGRGSNH